jgi:hypothetical protein
MMKTKMETVTIMIPMNMLNKENITTHNITRHDIIG